MAQPRRRYKLVSWDHQKNVGLATDGSAYEGEPILFTVRGADLDAAYDGRLDVGEVFMADESPNFLLFDVLIEDGPRGLVSQENYETQRKFQRKEPSKASVDIYNSSADAPLTEIDLSSATIQCCTPEELQSKSFEIRMMAEKLMSYNMGYFDGKEGRYRGLLIREGKV